MFAPPPCFALCPRRFNAKRVGESERIKFKTGRAVMIVCSEGIVADVTAIGRDVWSENSAPFDILIWFEKEL